MTKKDYEALAGAIRTVRDDGGDVATLVKVATRIAQVCHQDNARFDVTRFVTACGEVAPYATETIADVRRRRRGAKGVARG